MTIPTMTDNDRKGRVANAKEKEHLESPRATQYLPNAPSGKTTRRSETLMELTPPMETCETSCDHYHSRCSS